MKNKKIKQLNTINKEKISFYASIQGMISLLKEKKKDTADELKKAKLDYEISFWQNRLDDLFIMDNEIFDFIYDTRENWKWTIMQQLECILKKKNTK